MLKFYYNKCGLGMMHPLPPTLRLEYSPFAGGELNMFYEMLKFFYNHAEGRQAERGLKRMVS